jgi:hypothetical protein
MRSPNLYSLIFILLLAAFLRFYRIDAQSLWHDEGNSYQMTLKNADRIIGDAAADIHPPLYYFLLSAWRVVAGKSEFALRGLSAFFGIVLVTLVYRIGKKSFDETSALASAFFAAIHPALIYYSQEMRMYEMGAMLGAGCWLFVIGDRGLEIRSWKLEVGNWIALAVFIALGFYTHYSFAFIVIAINLYIIIRLTQYAIRNTRHASRNTHHPFGSRITLNYQLLITWLVPQLIALLIYLPWLPIAYRQLTTWPAARENLPIIESLIGVTRWLILGHTVDADVAIPALIGLAALIPLGLYRALPRGKNLLAIFLWLIVPSGLTVIFGLFSVAFSKFLIIAAPAMCLVLGVGAAGLLAPKVGEKVSLRWIIMRGSTQRAVAIIALAGGMLVALTMNLTLTNLYFNPLYARADYRGIARFLTSIAREGDVILTNSPSQEEVFRYYYTQQNVIPVARSRPLNMPEQIAELESISKTYKRIFVLYWGDGQADPKKVIESWLNEKTFKAYDQWYGDARLAAYAVNQTAGTMNQKVNARFGDRIRLEGYSINDSSFAAGDILQLTLFWNPQSLIANRYKIFVHVIGDPDSPPVAQHDGEPVGGLVLTTMWKPDEIVRDNHGVFLPLDLPHGDYKLAVGLYDVNSSERLTLADGSDKLFLDSIVVK